jgi:hypothetical protein
MLATDPVAPVCRLCHMSRQVGGATHPRDYRIWELPTGVLARTETALHQLPVSSLPVGGRRPENKAVAQWSALPFPSTHTTPHTVPFLLILYINHDACLSQSRTFYTHCVTQSPNHSCPCIQQLTDHHLRGGHSTLIPTHSLSFVGQIQYLPIHQR